MKYVFYKSEVLTPSNMNKNIFVGYNFPYYLPQGQYFNSTAGCYLRISYNTTL